MKSMMKPAMIKHKISGVVLLLLSILTVVSCGPDEEPGRDDGSDKFIRASDLTLSADEGLLNDVEIGELTVETNYVTLSFKEIESNAWGAIRIDPTTKKVLVNSADLFDYEFAPVIKSKIMVFNDFFETIVADTILVTINLNDITVNDDRTYVPDDNFERILIELGYDEGELDDYVPNANIADVTKLTLPVKKNSEKVIDLTGIGGFSSLDTLTCSYHFIENLELGKNTKLVTLYCFENKIKTFDLSKIPSLKTLIISDNELKELDLTENLDLEFLGCGGNPLVSLDLTNNTKLTGLSLNDLTISNIDLSKNVNLETLNTDINNIDLSNNINLKMLTVSGFDFTTLDISKNVNLISLRCFENGVTTLDLSNNKALEVLDLTDMPLTELDVSNNVELYKLKFSKTEVSSLELQGLSKLTFLGCPDNKISALDLNGTAVNFVFCSNNLLSSLSMKGITTTGEIDVVIEGNPDLSCIEVDDVDEANANWTKLDIPYQLTCN